MLRPRSAPCRPPRAALALACALACGTAALAAPRSAHANPAAEMLFRDGKRLLKAGNVDEACLKLGESQRLDPTSGTLLNLADCHEQQGKSATAWAEFLAAARLADTRGEKGRSGEALRRAARLEPKLSHLTIVAPSGVLGLVVKRNGEVIDATLLGSRLPTDPGEYVVTAEAKGYLPYRTVVVVKPDGDQASLDLPPLAPEPPAPAEAPPLAPPPAPVPPDTSATGRTAGFVAGGVGVAALGIGAAFGVMALSNYAKADDACPTHVDCEPRTVDQRDRAASQAWVANVGIGVGLAGIAAGTYLLFFAPGAKAGKSNAAGGRAKAGLVIAPHPTGLVAQGRF
jgi:tetratricopeptide (TPR) repeat protein